VLGRDERGVGGVATFVQGDAEELQPGADAAAGLGRVLADPPGEDQSIQAAECGGERPDPRLGAVTEQLDGLGCPDGNGLSGPEGAGGGAGLRDAGEAGVAVAPDVGQVEG